MKVLEFLADVLPSPGHGLYCVAELSSRKKEHHFVQTLEEIKPYVKQWLASKRNIFFALATYDPKVLDLHKDRRTANNARSIRALFLDLDGYESKRAAVESLDAFLKKSGLDAFPYPHIVSSGGGVHCYWPLTEDADIETWKPIAENLKRLCKQEGMRIDATVTADAARVLRIPGTLNFKDKYPTPREVKLLLQGGGRVDLRAFGAAVRAKLSAEFAPVSNNFLPAKVELAGERPTKANAKRSALAESLLNNSVTHFGPIWLKTERGEGCAQLAHYVAHAADDGMEPLWRGLLSWAKVCDDGPVYAAKLSEMHPYPPERTRQKLAEIKGPYPCVKMDGENPGVCPSCPYWGKITNALALGREVVASTEEKVYELPLTAATDEESADGEYLEDGFTSDDDEAGVAVNRRTRLAKRPPPPHGFLYGQHGGVFAEIQEKDSTGVLIKTQMPVLSHELFVVDMLRMGENDHMVHMAAIKTVGPVDTPEAQTTEFTPVIFHSKSVIAKDDLLKALAACNIYADKGAAADPFLWRYVRACVHEASRMRKAVDVPAQFGWQKNGTFVYNNRIFKQDGSEVSVPMPGLENLNQNTNSKGTIEEWRRPWELLIARKMHTMLALCADSFGSTLMRFSEYEGMVWHIGSTGSGTGKSLSLSLKAGVWGHPLRYRTGKGTSLVALQQRAGLLNSLPLLIDEITTKARGENDWASAFIFDISEGKGKERMESGTNRERVNNSMWSLTATTTANVHMSDVLLGKQEHSAHGEMMRLLEWNPSEELRFNDFERETLKLLRRNYGVAGEAWVRWLVQNQDTAQRVWKETHDMLRTALAFTDEERYWHAGCTSTVAASVLLGPQFSNIIKLPVKGIIDALRDLVNAARAAHRKSKRTAQDVLNLYTREFYGKFVVLRRDKERGVLAEFGAGAEGRASTRNTVLGRIEHGTTHPDYIEYFIEEQLLRRHCAAMSFGYADFQKEMRERQSADGYEVRFGVKKDLMSRTDGAPMRVVCMHLRLHKEKLDALGGLPLGDD